jgi:predicted RND superfamily exporter protein
VLKDTLNTEAEKLGFKKRYFKYAYASERPFVNYTEEAIKKYGIDIVKVNDSYVTYGTVNNNSYQRVLTYDFVESLSLKERFEESMETSMNMLLKLGILALIIIIVLFYFITKRAMLYAITFLIFPVAIVSVYAYFTDINILHIFMLFVILSIGIDYAIYLSKKNDNLTKKAISYSLISTFAGFGVLIFSSVNALFSMGMVATIGIVSIFVLLVFLKGVNDVS